MADVFSKLQLQRRRGGGLHCPGGGGGGTEISPLRPSYVEKLPPCLGHCPSGNDIRGWLKLIAERDKVGMSLEDACDAAWRLEVETNPALLQEIAAATGGQSFRAWDADALRKVFATIDRLERTEFTSTRLVHYRERFEPWALAALVLLGLALAVETAAGRMPW